jgi:hypothetical protein
MRPSTNNDDLPQPWIESLDEAGEIIGFSH